MRQLGVLLRLEYALLALAQAKTDVQTLLSHDELDALIREPEIVTWLTWMLERLPGGWKVP